VLNFLPKEILVSGKEGLTMAKKQKGVNNLEQTVEADDLTSTMVDTEIGPRNKKKNKKMK